MGGGFLKKSAFLEFSKVKIHNGCKFQFLKMDGGFLKKFAFLEYSKVKIHSACKL